MVESGTKPAIGSVAVLTIVSTGNMIWRFSSCCLPVMAQKAGAGNIVVFKSRQLLPVSG